MPDIPPMSPHLSQTNTKGYASFKSCFGDDGLFSAATVKFSTINPTKFQCDKTVVIFSVTSCPSMAQKRNGGGGGGGVILLILGFVHHGCHQCMGATSHMSQSGTYH